jgi:predicted DNA-binding transcriptional regulator YafY
MPRSQETIRQWKILRTLDAQRTGTHINGLAEDLGVSTRTIRRDLEALQDAGFPIYDEKRDGHTYWRIDERVFQRLSDVGLSLPEMSALYFGRRILECLVGPPFREDVQSALAKIAKVLPRQVREELDQVRSALVVKGDPQGELAPPGRRAQVTHLVQAILGHRRVDLRYYSMASRRRKIYTVEPYRLVFGDGALYLRAFVPAYGAMRTFAVSRMEHVTPREDTFDPVNDAAEDPFRHSMGVHTGPPIPVTLEFPARVAQYVRERVWHPSQTLEDLSGGRLRLRLRVSDDFALRSWILGFGRGVRVVEPPSLAGWMMEELEQMRMTYAGDEPGPDDRQAPLPFESVAPHLLGLISQTPRRSEKAK